MGRRRMSVVLAVVAVSASLALAGCGPPEQTLRARSGYDFNCPETQLSVVTIDDITRGVSGCGQKATYIFSCEHGHNGYAENCTWVLNSVPGAAPNEASPAPTPAAAASKASPPDAKPSTPPASPKPSTDSSSTDLP